MDLKNVLEIVGEINYIIDTTDFCELSHVYVKTDGKVIIVMFMDSVILDIRENPEITEKGLKREIIAEIEGLGKSAAGFIRHHKETSE